MREIYIHSRFKKDLKRIKNAGLPFQKQFEAQQKTRTSSF